MGVVRYGMVFTSLCKVGEEILEGGSRVEEYTGVPQLIEGKSLEHVMGLGVVLNGPCVDRIHRKLWYNIMTTQIFLSRSSIVSTPPSPSYTPAPPAPANAKKLFKVE